MTDEDLREVEVLEFSLTEKEIGDFVSKLNGLKQTKTSFTFSIDENNEFVVHFAGPVEEKKSVLEKDDEEFYEKAEEEGI